MGIIRGRMFVFTRKARALGEQIETAYAVPESGAVTIRRFGNEPSIDLNRSIVAAIAPAGDLKKLMDRFRKEGYEVVSQ